MRRGLKIANCLCIGKQQTDDDSLLRHLFDLDLQHDITKLHTTQWIVKRVLDNKRSTFLFLAELYSKSFFCYLMQEMEYSTNFLFLPFPLSESCQKKWITLCQNQWCAAARHTYTQRLSSPLMPTFRCKIRSAGFWWKSTQRGMHPKISACVSIFSQHRRECNP